MSLDWLDDPYAEFLDLPLGDRPPHYYELLELEIFCAQRERIEHAVRKQFRKIKPYQDHPDRRMREAIQDMMNQIASARVTLSNFDHKEAYDCELAERLGIDRHAILASRMATPVPDFALTVTAGPSGVGDTVELATDTLVTIGSDPHCMITLGSSRTAPLHGELRYRAGRWTYVQVAKGALSLVGDERVTEHELADGDRLEIGGYALRFRSMAAVRKVVSESAHPLTLIVTRGPSVPDAIFSAMPPESVLIGECETALWQLAGSLVSRHHCRVTFERGAWHLADLKSTNGTYVNGKRIARCELGDRDTITVGSFEAVTRLR